MSLHFPAPTERHGISIETPIISHARPRAEAKTDELSCSEYLIVTHEIGLAIKEVERREMQGVTEELILDVKKLIIARLKLEEISIADIDSEAPLFGEGLGLDSIDALELVIGLEKEYGVSIPDAEVGKKVFQSVRAIAQYIVDNQGQTVAADGAA